MLEKDFEEIICKYPELIEEGLTLSDRQLSFYGRRMNFLFQDKFNRKLVIELKAGPIKDEHVSQILSYEAMLLTTDDPTLRVMLVGNRVPPNIQKSLDYYGIAWKEIDFSFLREFLQNKGDESFNHLFKYDEPVVKTRINQEEDVCHQQESLDVIKNNFDLIERLKFSESYKNFKEILPMKIHNEGRAKQIIEKNIGHLRQEHLRDIFRLVDETYPFKENGRIVSGPWFSRLLKPNAINIYDEDSDKINRWFSIVSDNNFSAKERIDSLLSESHKIRGLNVGFITLMLYIINKTDYSIWFESQHIGLRIIYPKLEKYTGKSVQYSSFNDLSKDFAKKYNFEHTELDWLFSWGFPHLSRDLKNS